ncbi:MAG: DNA repair protein RadA [Candidatus Obscuribacterales bacterium]|nr:DNA repair protein RadA [Candidatus Obscuribacterales bacterium]
MARVKSRWTCQECGFSTSRSLGRCTECNTWNSFIEEVQEEEVAAKKGFAARLALGAGAELEVGDVSGAVNMEDIPVEGIESAEYRLKTGLEGLDEVLGGGLVPGCVVLLAGDPGIGKSTLLLQVTKEIARLHKVLYVSGEESAAQVKLRAMRLGVTGGSVMVNATQDVANIRESMLTSGCRVAIIDSIQAIYHPQISSAPGSVSQVRESAAVLVSAAKAQNIATILVGHVTKDGSIAGPRVLEHMVDVVLQFEGDRARQLRILKPVKNRFGSTQELAIFSMTELGLMEVDNPSALFLGDRLSKLGRKQAPSGTAVISGGEGNRALLLEVQALVGSSTYPSPRRVANGWDYNRLLQVIAVLEKKVGLSLSHHDVYMNIVGGLDFSDPCGDLGIALAIATSLLDRSIDPGLLCIGEIGLTGEVRPVSALPQRLKEAARLGFRRALVPAGNLPLDFQSEQIEVVGCESLSEALVKAMPGFELNPAKKKVTD